MLPNLANLPPKKEREGKPKGRESDYTAVKMQSEVPLLCIMHPTYFRVHYVSGHNIVFLQQMSAAEIRPWTFMFGARWIRESAL